MAVNLLSMCQESTECTDCQESGTLAECEHCKQPVCGDCRVAHNVLQCEINTLLQSIQRNVFETPENEERTNTARCILEKTRQIETDISNAFDEAAKLSAARLVTRKEELLRQVQPVAKFLGAVVEGKQKSSVIQETRQKMSSCHSSDGLRELKRTLAIVEASGHTNTENQDGPVFSYDLRGLLGTCENMGAIAFGGECSVHISNECQLKPSKKSTFVAQQAAVVEDHNMKGDERQRKPSDDPASVIFRFNKFFQRPPIIYGPSGHNMFPQHPGMPFGQPLPQPPRAVMAQGQKPLTASELAAAQPKDQKQMLGERLFPLINAMFPDWAGKITGMLLEMNNSDLLHMLEYNESLQSKVEEAVQVLKAHNAKESETK